MKIYTKTGDSGTTALFSGERLSKTDTHFEVLGALDELTAVLGLAYDSAKNKTARERLETLQHQLFRLASDVATRLESVQGKRVRRIEAIEIAWLETGIDEMTEQLPALKNFIYPAGCFPATLIHFARTIARRAERHAFRLGSESKLNAHALIYLNRLSDYLFTLARWVQKSEKKKERTLAI